MSPCVTMSSAFLDTHGYSAEPEPPRTHHDSGRRAAAPSSRTRRPPWRCSTRPPRPADHPLRKKGHPRVAARVEARRRLVLGGHGQPKHLLRGVAVFDVFRVFTGLSFQGRAACFFGHTSWRLWEERTPQIVSIRKGPERKAGPWVRLSVRFRECASLMAVYGMVESKAEPAIGC